MQSKEENSMPGGYPEPHHDHPPHAQIIHTGGNLGQEHGDPYQNHNQPAGADPHQHIGHQQTDDMQMPDQLYPGDGYPPEQPNVAGEQLAHEYWHDDQVEHSQPRNHHQEVPDLFHMDHPAHDHTHAQQNPYRHPSEDRQLGQHPQHPRSGQHPNGGREDPHLAEYRRQHGAHRADELPRRYQTTYHRRIPEGQTHGHYHNSWRHQDGPYVQMNAPQSGPPAAAAAAPAPARERGPSTGETMQMMMMSQVMMQQMQAQQMQAAQMAAMTGNMMNGGNSNGNGNQQQNGGCNGNGCKERQSTSINVQNCNKKGKKRKVVKAKAVKPVSAPPVVIQPVVKHARIPPPLPPPPHETSALDNWQEATIILCLAVVGLIYLVSSRSSPDKKTKEASLPARMLT